MHNRTFTNQHNSSQLFGMKKSRDTKTLPWVATSKPLQQVVVPTKHVYIFYCYSSPLDLHTHTCALTCLRIYYTCTQVVVHTCMYSDFSPAAPPPKMPQRQRRRSTSMSPSTLRLSVIKEQISEVYVLCVHLRVACEYSIGQLVLQLLT